MDAGNEKDVTEKTVQEKDRAEDLLPCPFCGSSNLSKPDNKQFSRYIIRCYHCGAQGGPGGYKKVREKWNTRTGESFS